MGRHKVKTFDPFHPDKVKAAARAAKQKRWESRHPPLSDAANDGAQNNDNEAAEGNDDDDDGDGDDGTQEKQAKREPLPLDEHRIPRGLRRIMASAKQAVAGKKAQLLAAKGPKRDKATGTLPTELRPGESVRQFNRRVDEAASRLMQERVEATHTVSDKRKAFLKERKKKQLDKKRKHNGNSTIHGNGSSNSSGGTTAPTTDRVRFGEVAQDIPHFTTLPRTAAAKAKPALPSGNEDASSASKPAGKSAADERILAAERDRVVAHYRQLKLARQLQYQQ